MFNCKVGTFPITYLDLPLRPGSLLPIIDKVERNWLCGEVRVFLVLVDLLSSTLF